MGFLLLLPAWFFGRCFLLLYSTNKYERDEKLIDGLILLLLSVFSLPLLWLALAWYVCLLVVWWCGISNPRGELGAGRKVIFHMKSKSKTRMT